MTKRTTSVYGGEATITEFEFDVPALTTLSIKTFDGANEEWALFVLANRSWKNQ